MRPAFTIGGHLRITAGNAGGHVDISGGPATPAGGGAHWELCGGPGSPNCAGKLPGANQFAESLLLLGGALQPLGIGLAPDRSFASGAPSAAESFAVTRPAGSGSGGANSFTTTVDWTVVP